MADLTSEEKLYVRRALMNTASYHEDDAHRSKMAGDTARYDSSMQQKNFVENILNKIVT